LSELDAGVHEFTNGVHPQTVGGGSQTITICDWVNSLSDTATVSVSAAAASTITLTAPASTTAGDAFTVDGDGV